jgi:2'-5' RNA ligase
MTKFEPHVTLVRKFKGQRSQNLPVPDADMTITKVSLMKSETQNGKQVYKEIYAVSAT